MKNWFAASALFLGVCLVLTVGWHTRAADKGETSTKGFPAYTVVMTDGSHLVVTDNQANKVYFYAIGPDEKVGDPLTLRGSADLTQVGKPTITPVTNKKK